MMLQNLIVYGLLFMTLTCTAAAPLITHLSWGKVVVKDDAGEHEYRDCMITPESSQAWDWRDTGTRHTPGILVADLKRKIDKKEFIDTAEIIILSSGMQNMLHIDDATIGFLEKLGKKYYVKQTEEAVKLYNQLVHENEKVGIFIHSTC